MSCLVWGLVALIRGEGGLQEAGAPGGEVTLHIPLHNYRTHAGG